MKLSELVKLAGNEPVFSSGLLLAGNVSPAAVRLQLSRWVRSGKIVQLRRGLYTLAEPFAQKKPHPFYLSNCLKKASYVSLQSGLSHHGLIPEQVPVTTAVTTGRPETFTTPLGRFSFRHIKMHLFNQYTETAVYEDQRAFVAEPEKCLLDLLYLTPHSDTPGFIRELRLQNTERLDLEKLARMATASCSAKLVRAVKLITDAIKNEEYEPL